MRKLSKGISAPLGVIFGVLLAIILVILAVFIAFNISTTAVKSQAGQLVLVGQPVAFHDSNYNLTKLAFTVKNPSGEEISITGFIISGESINLMDSIRVGSQDSVNVELWWDSASGMYKVRVGGENPTDTDRTSMIDVSEAIPDGYLEFVIVTDKATITGIARLIQVGG